MTTFTSPLASRAIPALLSLLLAIVACFSAPISHAQAIAVSVGDSHSCAIMNGGAVKCWGSNTYGQAGDTMTGVQLRPVGVVGLTSGVAAIAAGGNHTCALTVAGGVKCWGFNNIGQLGDGSTTDRRAPVDVPGLTSGVAAITAGGASTCALTMAGGVKCWGANYSGELGDGSFSPRWLPVDVVGLTSGVAKIATGGSHTCAIMTSGGAKCWGQNTNGELGDGTSGNYRTTPVDVTGLTAGVVAIAPGFVHTCALMTSGGVKCWGYDYSSGGAGSTPPLDVTGLSSGD
jgi:alpha-tubulin suppressor-like RCC1 family protein